MPLFALAVPLLAPFFQNSLSTTDIPTISLNEIAVKANQAAENSSLENLHWLQIIYLIGSSLLLLGLLFGLFKAWRLKSSAQREARHLYYSSQASTAFTFFRSIILPVELQNSDNLPAILKHEQVHARQLHSLDNLYYGLLRAFFWFNPFIHLLAKELRQIHECIADGEASQNTSREDYAKLLLSSALGSDLMAMGTANPFFNSSLIKTRITMLYKKKTNSKLKILYLTLLPFIMMMVVMACQKTEQSDNKSPTSTALEQKSDILSFSQVDQPPLFENCDANALHNEQMICFQRSVLEYVSKNFKYPEKAKEEKLEGKIFVQFLIGKDGMVQETNIAASHFPKDADPLAVEQAENYTLQLIKNLPKMTPALHDGKKVKVTFTLPINMKLS